MDSRVVERLPDVLFHGIGFLLGQTHLRPFDEDGADKLPQDVLAEEEADFALMPVLRPRPDGHLVGPTVDVDEACVRKDAGERKGDLEVPGEVGAKGADKKIHKPRRGVIIGYGAVIAPNVDAGFLELNPTAGFKISVVS